MPFSRKPPENRLKKSGSFPLREKEPLFVVKIVKEGDRCAMNEAIEQEKRIAVVSILVTDRSVSEQINALLSAYGDWIIGRMGIPYREKKVSVLSVVLDAPVETTNALTGKLGKMQGVSVKALFGKI